jgi:hypothetical protein
VAPGSVKVKVPMFVRFTKFVVENTKAGGSKLEIPDGAVSIVPVQGTAALKVARPSCVVPGLTETSEIVKGGARSCRHVHAVGADGVVGRPGRPNGHPGNDFGAEETSLIQGEYRINH